MANISGIYSLKACAAEKLESTSIFKTACTAQKYNANANYSDAEKEQSKSKGLGIKRMKLVLFTCISGVGGFKEMVFIYLLPALIIFTLCNSPKLSK